MTVALPPRPMIRPALAAPGAAPKAARVAVLGLDTRGGASLDRLLARHPRFEPAGDPSQGDEIAWHRAAADACVNLLPPGSASAALAACAAHRLPVVDLSGSFSARARDEPTTLHGCPALLGTMTTLARRVAIPPLRASAVSLMVGPLAQAGLLTRDSSLCVVANGHSSDDLERDAVEAQRLIDGLTHSSTAPAVVLVARNVALDGPMALRVRVGRLSLDDARAIYEQAYRGSPTVEVTVGPPVDGAVPAAHLARLSVEEDPTGLWLDCRVDPDRWLQGQVLETLNRMFGHAPELGLELPGRAPAARIDHAPPLASGAR